jgi:hypothetical protein
LSGGLSLFPEEPPLAVLSPCGFYRYILRRGARCHSNGGVVNWIMLNPSTADASLDDPTIRRCVGFSRAWDFEDLVVTNLFALRSTDPDALRHHPDPIGPENDDHLREQARRADLVILAWGACSTAKDRGPEVLVMLRGLGVRPHCLATTGGGYPGHPLYLPGGLVPKPFG